MWVVLVIFNNKQSNISQEAYKTYNEALAEMKKKDIKQLDDYKFIANPSCKYVTNVEGKQIKLNLDGGKR